MVVIAFCIGILIGLVLGMYAAVSWAKNIVDNGGEHKFVKSVQEFRKKRGL